MHDELAEQIAAAEPDGGEPATDVILARAQRLRRRRAVGSAALAAALVVTVAVGLAVGLRDRTVVLSPQEDEAHAPAEAQRGPYSPEAVIDPTRMELEPVTGRAGQTVSIRFPTQAGRGICFSLERRVSGEWDARYLLYASPGSATESVEPTWARLADDAIPDPCPDVQIEGPGPDHVRIPVGAAPGRYRICTVHTGADYCAELHVSD